jgi:hypothetical protein
VQPAQRRSREGRTEPLGEQNAGRTQTQRLNLKPLRGAHPVELQRRDLTAPTGEKRSDPSLCRPPKRERQRRAARPIKPLHVVDRDQQRPLLREPPQQPQGRARNRAWVRRRTAILFQQ